MFGSKLYGSRTAITLSGSSKLVRSHFEKSLSERMRSQKRSQAAETLVSGLT